MKIVKESNEVTFIACESKPKNTGERIVFISEAAFNFVKYYIEFHKIKVSKKYREEDKHWQLVKMLGNISRFNECDISNSLSALGF